MKLKKILVVSILLLAVFLIYLTTMDKKIYFLTLGDSMALGKSNYSDLISKYLEQKELLEEYHNEFIEDDARITDLIEDIEENKKVKINNKEKTIKNALIKSDLVILSIGNEELFYKMRTEHPNGLYNYIDEMMQDMDNLLKKIREYCKEDVFILGYINPFSNEMDEYIEYANNQLQELTKQYQIHYIELKGLSKKSMYNETGFTEQGHKTISNLCYPLIEKYVLRDEK